MQAVSEKIYNLCFDIISLIHSVKVLPSPSIPPPTLFSSRSFPWHPAQPYPFSIPSYSLDNCIWLSFEHQVEMEKRKGRSKRAINTSGEDFFSSTNTEYKQKNIMLSSVADYINVVLSIFDYVRDYTFSKSAGSFIFFFLTFFLLCTICIQTTAVESLHYFGRKEALDCLRIWKYRFVSTEFDCKESEPFLLCKIPCRSFCKLKSFSQRSILETP